MVKEPLFSDGFIANHRRRGEVFGIFRFSGIEKGVNPVKTANYCRKMVNPLQIAGFGNKG
jgi:hypothetical protein